MYWIDINVTTIVVINFRFITVNQLSHIAKSGQILVFSVFKE